MSASNKIEFHNLNGNLIVLKILPLTLRSDCNSRDGRPQRQTASLQTRGAMAALMTTRSHHHFHRPAETLLAAQEGQCTCQENKNERHRHQPSWLSFLFSVDR